MKQRGIALVLASALAASLASCGAKEAFVQPDPELVQGFTGGVISRHGTVLVTFAADLGKIAGDKAPPGAFRLDPPIAGDATWTDAHNLEFRPASPLAPGKVYTARVDLAALGAAKVGAEPYCNFDFAVLRNDFSVEIDPIASPKAGGPMVLTGAILSGDSEDPAKVEGVLSVGYPASAVAVSWKHDASGKTHEFTVSGIARGDSAGELGLSWSGGPISSPSSGAAKVAVPAKGDFSFLGARAVRKEETFVEASFSEALDPAQDLRGLIEASGVASPRYSVQGSRVRIYSASGEWPSSLKLSVQPGVRDGTGRSLAIAAAASVDFDYQIPAVRFAGTGVIVPTSQGTTVPVETMNLNSIIVEAVRIYGDNMPQFLQVNELDGVNEVYRVGKVVYHKRLALKWDPSLKNQWVRQGLDLSELLKASPDGMFQVRVLFDRAGIEYQCPRTHKDFKGLDFPEPAFPDGPKGESSYWDYYEGYYEDGEWVSPYSYVEDPCHPVFYKQLKHFARRNVLVSDVGLLAKAGADGTYHLFASDLRSAEPLKDVALTLLDFQLQKLGTAKTDGSGMAALKVKEAPAFLVASVGKQLGFLKLDDSESLSMSLFDVGGDSSPTGVKGMIYGERGVWRPGDDIYLTFLLYDRTRSLPKGYPINFELQDPRGTIAFKQTVTDAVDGFYSIKCSTSSEAPTGDWLARVKAGGLTFTKNVKVESIMPNRLKMSLDFGSTKPYLDTYSHDMTLTAKWLHGADASGLKADVTAVFSSVPTSFPGYGDYVFDDSGRNFATSRQVLFDGTLDASGRAEFTAGLQPGTDAPGKLRATIQTRVFESGGAFSTETFPIDCHPYDEYVGLRLPKGDEARGMLLVDTDQTTSVVLVDRDGKPVPSGTVRVELYKVAWRWWWESSSSASSEYKEAESRTLVSSGEVDIVDGKGSWKFNVKYPEWGRFMVVATDRAGGHSASKVVYIDWPGWAGRGGKDGAGGASMLTVQAGKPKYAAGETATVSFPSNAASYALVAVESRGKIAKKQWVKCAGASTAFSFAVDGTMAPNVYVHVTLLQPHMQTANDLPIRLYGAVPVMVEDPATRIVPVLDIPAKIAPGDKVSFKVSEKSGLPMTYTVAVVDEGLLGITKFKAPNPWDTFYRKESSLLRNWDLYQYVSGAYSGKLDSILAIGGGEDPYGSGAKKANRFKPVVQFFTATKLEKGKQNTHSFTMPEYIGSVRFMVVAASGGAFGVAEKETPVKSDLMVQSTLPRVLSPGEKLSLPVTFFDYMPGARTVELKLEVSGPLAIDGAATKSVKVSAEGEQTVYFSAKVADRIGMAKVTVRASSGAVSVSSTTEIDVRPLGAEAVDVYADIAGPGRSMEKEITLPGAAGTNSLVLELSKFPPIDLERRLEYLIQYPHGCIEQTTSSVFPQLYLDKVVTLSAVEKAKVQDNVKAGLERLKTFQTAAGGFSYWPGEGSASEWGSNYAGHFMVEAERAGYALPPGMKDAWLQYQKQAAVNWSNAAAGDEIVQAYRLYGLALAKRPEIGAMNRLRERISTVQARWRLAAAYKLAGMDAAAVALVRGVPVEVSNYRELGYTYGSDYRDSAMILEALYLVGDMAQAGKLAIKLSTKLAGDSWLSTQETAYALIALLPFAGKDASKDPIGYSYALADGTVKTGILASPMARIDVDPGAAATKFKLKLTNTGSSNLFYRWIARGTPALGKEKDSSMGLSIGVEYYDADRGRTVNPDDIAFGKDMIIQVTVSNNSGEDVENIALTHRVPSGWEIANERVGVAEGDGVAAPAKSDYVDIRDDRVLTYFSLKRGEAKTFAVRVNKSYDGTFYLPAVYAEAMYAADEFRAVAAGRWLKAPK